MSDDKEIKQTKETKTTHTKVSKKQTQLAAMIVGALVLLVIGFASGIQYQKGKKTTVPAGTAPGMNAANGGTTRGGRFGGGARLGAFGTVKTISGTSITVSNQRTGADQTFAIDSATTITDGGTASSVDAIKVGDSVIVRATTSDAAKAAAITLNPQMGGGFGGGPQGAGGGTPPVQAN